MRDDFDKETKDVLARRVGYLCSNPSCRKLTSGPRTEPTKALNIGVAAHITAAAPGGPRYDPTLSPQERKSAGNGLWLCQNCAKLVDNDEQRYTTSLLRAWKKQAEIAALAAIESLASQDLPVALQSFSRSETLKYLVLGIDNESWLPWFSLFADERSSFTSTEPIEEVYFDNLHEMQEVFTTLKNVVAKAEVAEQRGIDRQQAFERALFEASISRVSRFLFTPKQDTPVMPGVKYVVFGIRPDHVNTIRLLRPQTLLHGQATNKRDATEVFFKNAAIVPHIPHVVGKAAQAANGDNDKFWQLLFEAALRLRWVGPDEE
ncbi:MAG: hypothetical protein M3R24_26395 [Chloroflexota bacterium]|nr:hypothetical protein [Chloroflexota bacterium]